MTAWSSHISHPLNKQAFFPPGMPWWERPDPCRVRLDTHVEDFPFRPGLNPVWTKLLLQLRRTAQAAKPFQIVERPPEQSTGTESQANWAIFITGLRVPFGGSVRLWHFLEILNMCTQPKSASNKARLLGSLTANYRSQFSAHLFEIISVAIISHPGLTSLTM